MGHTKRSTTFNRELSRLREKLRANTLDAGERARLVEILENNTTDSPCIVKAANDEPIFVLRGQDELAAECVQSWAHRFADAREQRNELPEDVRAKALDALECSREMELYPGRRLPN